MPNFSTKNSRFLSDGHTDSYSHSIQMIHARPNYSRFPIARRDVKSKNPLLMSIVSSKTLDSVPAHGVLAVGRVAIGCALGLLIAGRIRHSVRQTTALALLAAGLVVNLPSIVSRLNEFINGPQSNRGLQKRLRSIRRDIDLPEEEHDERLY